MNEQQDIPVLDSHWNYRVIRKVFDRTEINGQKYVRFGIHEVYYTDGKPSMCTVDSMDPHGETFEELKQDLKYHQLALTKPVLNYEDIGNETTDTETTT